MNLAHPIIMMELFKIGGLTSLIFGVVLVVSIQYNIIALYIQARMVNSLIK
jgi:hypothetical protein